MAAHRGHDNVVKDAKFPDTPQLSAVATAQNSAAIPCGGCPYALIKTTYSDSGGTVPIRIIFLDENAKEAMSVSITPPNSGIAADGGARYHGEVMAIDNFGFKSFKMRVDAVPSAGNVSLYGQGV